MSLTLIISADSSTPLLAATRRSFAMLWKIVPAFQLFTISAGEEAKLKEPMLKNVKCLSCQFLLV